MGQRNDGTWRDRKDRHTPLRPWAATVAAARRLPAAGMAAHQGSSAGSGGWGAMYTWAGGGAAGPPSLLGWRLLTIWRPVQPRQVDVDVLLVGYRPAGRSGAQRVGKGGAVLAVRPALAPPARFCALLVPSSIGTRYPRAATGGRRPLEVLVHNLLRDGDDVVALPVLDQAQALQRLYHVVCRGRVGTMSGRVWVGGRCAQQAASKARLAQQCSTMPGTGPVQCLAGLAVAGALLLIRGLGAARCRLGRDQAGARRARHAAQPA